MRNEGFLLKFTMEWIVLFFLLITISSVSCIEVTLYDTTKLDSLGWTTYSPGLSTDRLGWREASYSTSGGEVLRVYTICNIDYSAADNWARTPFLQRTDANRLYITMRFTMRRCSRHPDPSSVQLCKESFKLFYRESDDPTTDNATAAWDESAYRSVDVIAADKLFTEIDNATINEITRSVAVTRRGVYLAFQDQGACMTLLSVRVYYVVCPDAVVNLTVFGRTVAGPELTSVVQARAVCAPYAVAEQVLYALCMADGSWMDLVVDGCRCIAGFQKEEERGTCEECPIQTYKSQTGNGPCIVCPANSNTTTTGATGCLCNNGFSRQAFDGVNASCTNLPGPVEGLRVNFVNQTFAGLSWQPPSDRTGNYKDASLSYRAQCPACPAGVVYSPKQAGLISPSVDLIGLNPSTSYRVTIYVDTSSSSSSSTSSSVGADIAFTTTSFFSGLPRIANLYVARIGTDSLDLVWTVLDVDPSTVTSFEVRYLEMAAGNTTHSISTAFPNATVSGLSSSTVYIFQVRGRVSSSSSWGDYSNPVSAKTDLRSGTSETYLPVVSQSPNIVAIIVGTAVGVVVCVVIVAVVAVVLIYRRKKRSCEGNSSDCDMLKYINGAQSIGRVHVNHSSSSLPSTSGTDSLHIYADPFAYEDPMSCTRERVCEIEPAAITIEAILLKGSYGNVCVGKLMTPGATEVPIMIESLNENTSEEDRIHLLSKAEILWRLSHPNVIALRGVVSRSTPYMMVTEFMSNGSLAFFIKENGFRLTMGDLVEMLRGLASAMEYITEQSYILRDLSAKSIQVDGNLVCKLSSFEMLSFLNADGVQYDQTENVLVRWSSPEVLTHRRYSVASDVWSFGVVMWEVASLGETPYTTWPDEQVARAVINGTRLQAPQNCPEVLSQLMVKCWAPIPDQRPSFSYLVRSLQTFKQAPPTQRGSVHESISPALTPDLRTSPVSLAQQHYGSVEIGHWLASLQLSCYAPNFHSRGYRTVNHVVHLSEIDFDQMGITVPAHQRTLLRAIRCLKIEAPYAGANDYFV